MGCCNNFGNQRNQRDRHGNRPGCRRCPILPGFPRIF